LRDFKDNFQLGENFKERYIKSCGLIIDEFFKFETHPPNNFEKEPETILSETMKSPLVMYSLKKSISLKEKNLLKEFHKNQQRILLTNPLLLHQRLYFQNPIDKDLVNLKVFDKFGSNSIQNNSIIYETKGGWFSGFTVYCYLGFHSKKIL
jgi:hypothetical protein